MLYTMDFTFLADAWPDLFRGAAMTALLATFSILIGFVIGALCAVLRNAGPPAVKVAVGTYVELIRNTPMLIQIFIIYFGLSSVGLRLSAELAAIIALSVNTGAYATEIVRAGIESVARGQIEAAECLGLTRAQTYWYVVIQPAIQNVYPALSSQFVLVMLASSATSQISADELTATANVIQSITFRNFEVYLIVAALYLALATAFRLVLGLIGHLVFARPYGVNR